MKIYLDTADFTEMQEWSGRVDGFTTNPTLMKKGGVDDYEWFGKRLVTEFPDKALSFEVLSDNWNEMESQAYRIAEWGANVYVKIPVVNTKGETSEDLIGKLAGKGLRLNVTAVLTRKQVDMAGTLLAGKEGIVSVFAGRIADAGIDPEQEMSAIRKLLPYRRVKLLWASTREAYNIVQAKKAGCDIITVPPDILRRYVAFRGKDLNDLSRETVQQFYRDGVHSGLALGTEVSL